MLRFTLHRKGQDSPACKRWHAIASRGLLLAPPSSAGPGCRPRDLNVQPFHRLAEGFPTALKDRVCALGEIR